MSASEVRAVDPASDRMLSAGERRSLYLYLLPLVLVPCLLFVAALLIVPTPWFMEHTGSDYLPNMGYATTLHNTRCDVLVYGDSSALLAVDPAIVQAETGLSACNIAEFEGITLMDGTDLVDTFLRNNPRPRLLLFLYTPDDLSRPRKWPPISMFEAISYNLEYRRNLRTVLTLLSHPDESFAWAELGMRRAIQRARSPAMPQKEIHQREAGRGVFRPEPSIAQDCPQAPRETAPDIRWVAALRSRYGVNGTRVLVDATPTAPCDPNLKFFREHIQGVVDNSSYPTIPVTSFGTNGHLHTNAAGTKLISTMIAAQIKATLNVAGPLPAAAPHAGGR